MTAKRGEGPRREESRAYYEANRETLKAKARAGYAAHRDARRATAARYRAEHQGEIVTASKVYRDANRGAINAGQKAYRAANPEKVAASKRRWYEANHERVAASKAAWLAANRDRARDRYLQRHYGITLDEYNALLASQGGGCRSCGGAPTGRHNTFRVDHDHETGQIRGLLCDSCNLAIGKLGDTVEGVEGALDYLIAARRRAARWTEAVA